jgi:hypothetical protein
MHQIYPASGRVPEPWQPGQVGYILPPSDISDLAEISLIILDSDIRDNMEDLIDSLQDKISHPIYMKCYG